MVLSIVIPVYNALEFARACVDSVFAARPLAPFEIIVVNNGSSSDVDVWLRDAAQRYAELRIIHFDEALGFSRAVNEGMRAALGEFLIILNSDTIVTEGWADRLLDAMRGSPELGVASPVTNRCGNPAQVDPESRDLKPEEAQKYAERVRGRITILREPQRLVFFCAMIRRTVWERLGGLDEIYRQGNFEDDDFCARAGLLGFELAVVPASFVYHHERKTFDDNRLRHGEAFSRNQEIFLSRIARWSCEAQRLAKPRALPSRKISVLMPVLPETVPWFRDSLVSVRNQTASIFEILAISPVDLTEALAGADEVVYLPAKDGSNLAALLNEGMKALTGDCVAFCPAGDIWFPFHLEILQNALREGAGVAYSAWSFLSGERTGAVRLDQAEIDRVAIGDWIPLVAWICREPQNLPRFDETLRDFAGWQFALEMAAGFAPVYIRRVSCRKRAAAPSSDEAAWILHAIAPAKSAWHAEEQRLFLRATVRGAWEPALILERNEIERRARMLLAPPQPLAGNRRELELCAARLQSAASAQAVTPTASSSLPDVLHFSILEWDQLTQRPHHLARGLARAGHRVFWIDVKLQAPPATDSANLVRQLEPNLLHVELPAIRGDLYQLQWSPPVLDAMEAAIRFLKSRYRISSALQVVNFPKWWPLVERLYSAFGWPVIYDCLDDQQAFGSLHPNNDAHFEPALVAASDLLIASGRILYERLGRSHANAVLLPNACDYELFSSAAARELPENARHPIAGFAGAFSEWLDREWILKAARHFPEWSFLYIGREGFARPTSRKEWQAIANEPNVQVLPQADPVVLAGYLAGFDVCIMPFRDLPITQSMNPVKIYEYLAAGKLVVAPDLPETRPFADMGLIHVYQEEQQAFQLLERAAALNDSPDVIERRKQFAASNTWNHRIVELQRQLLAVSRSG